MRKPWEEVSAWVVCECCKCEYNCEAEGDAYLCQDCIDRQAEEALLDEIGEDSL